MREWLLPLLAGGAAGVLSGFGVGGGTLLLVYMTAFAGLDQRLAQGINLLYFLPSAAMALPAHWRNGSVVRPVLLPAILAGLLTAGVTAWVATVVEVELLRRCFGGFLNHHRGDGTVWEGAGQPGTLFMKRLRAAQFGRPAGRIWIRFSQCRP